MRLLKLSFLTLITGLLVFTIACQKEQETDQTAQGFEQIKAEVLKATNGQTEEIVFGESVIEERCPGCPVPEPTNCNIKIYAWVASGAKITITFPLSPLPIVVMGAAARTIILNNTTIKYADVFYDDLPGAGGGLSIQIVGGTGDEVFTLPAGAPDQTRRFELCEPITEAPGEDG